MPRSILLLAGLVACGGLKADDFVLQYTDAYCGLRLDCGDVAGLVFEGADTLESCQAAYGPIFVAEGQGCALKASLAKDCLDAMETLQCPADGDVDGSLPPVCATVWQKCEAGAGGEETNPSAEDDTGAAR